MAAKDLDGADSGEGAGDGHDEGDHERQVGVGGLEGLVVRAHQQAHQQAGHHQQGHAGHHVREHPHLPPCTALLPHFLFKSGGRKRGPGRRVRKGEEERWVSSAPLPLSAQENP
eukprot:797117-Prorocentrum_minimum.AAC.2